MIASAQITWERRVLDDNLQGARDVFVIDLDGDGDHDILSAAMDQDEITWWDNDGHEQYTRRPISTTFDGAISVYAGDIDNDGDIDIAGAGFYAGDIAVWYNDGQENFTRTDIYTTFSGAICVRMADINGDGHVDLLAASSAQGRVCWWHNWGDGSFGYRAIAYGFADARDVVAADLDDDGDLDILGVAAWNHQVAWWENQGTTYFPKHIIAVGFECPYGVDAADINGDGTLDVVAASTRDDEVAWWKNNREDGFTKYEIDNYTDATDVFAADLDNDGDVDILASSPSSVRWYQNLGDNSFAMRAVSSVGNDFRKVIAADVDLDGDLDVLSAADECNNLTWYRQIGSPEPVYIELVSPNGSEVWRPGTTQDITWTSPRLSDVRIELLSGQQETMVLADATENDGCYTLTVPDDVVFSTDCWIHLSLVSGEDDDTSNQPFTIAPLPTLETLPLSSSISVPEDGGGVWYRVEITNPGPVPGACHFWTELVLPNGRILRPMNRRNIQLNAGGQFSPARPFGQFIPGFAPAGTYIHRSHLGVYPDLSLVTDSFHFYKLGEVLFESPVIPLEPGERWETWGWDQFDTDEDQPPQENLIPTACQMLPAYPNPFNAKTTISISLPEAADLSITVFNLAGQVVAELADSHFSAGSHHFSLNADRLASGMYFMQAYVPGKLNDIQKVMLVR